MPVTNRAEQQDLPFEIRRSGIQGKGAFATRRIRKGERIIEYTGEIITVEESDRRYDDDSMSRHHTFLFSLDNGTVIDGAVGGNESRFINHSCAPNCEANEVKGRIYIEALRTIEPGEELAYDYAYEREGFEDEKWEKLYVCHCGAESCRGTILAPPKEKKKRRPAKSAAKKKSTASPKKRSGAKTKSKPASKNRSGAKTKSKPASKKRSGAKTKSKSSVRTRARAGGGRAR